MKVEESRSRETRRIVYRAANGWTVREIRYSTIRGRLVPDCAGEKWFEVFDADGYNYCNYIAGEATFEEICAVAEAGDSAVAMKGGRA